MAHKERKSGASSAVDLPWRSFHVACMALISSFLLGPITAGAEEVTVPLERETIVIPGGLEEWDLAFHGSLVEMHTLEWITGGETVEDWSQLFTVQRLLVDAGLGSDAFAKLALKSLAKSCPDVDKSILDSSHESTTYEWIVQGCPGSDDQHELVRAMRSGDYLFRIAYTVKDGGIPEDTRAHWLDVLASIRPRHSWQAEDAGLSQIPLIQLYQSFKTNGPEGMKLMFNNGYLFTSGFPQDHIYDVFWIRQSPYHDFYAMPFAQGLIADEKGALNCPAAPTSEDAGDLETSFNFCAVGGPGKPLSQLMLPIGRGFQRGLPIAFAVRSQDRLIATHLRLTLNPIKGKNKSCTVELELVSNDARTFVAYGRGFPPEEEIALSWKYGPNKATHSTRTGSKGRFSAAINHPGPATGSRKWDATLEASSSKCRVKVRYKWGTAGMQP